MALWHALCAAALLQPPAAAPAPEPEPPPESPQVQRPSTLVPSPGPDASASEQPSERGDDTAIPATPADPAAPPPAEPEPADIVPADRQSDDPQPDEAAPHQVAASGVITGTATDTEVDGIPIVGAGVQVVCPCLAEPIFTVTDVAGQFELTGLPQGVYTVMVERGGRPTQRTVGLGQGEQADLALRVGPPTSTEELDRRDYERARASTMIAMGGVAGVTAVLLFIGAGVENAKPDCKFGLDDCANAPRPGVTAALGITGGILTAAAAALIGVGVHRTRRLDAQIAFDDRSASIGVRGRF